MQRVISEFEFIGSVPSSSAASSIESPSPPHTPNSVLKIKYRTEFPQHRFPHEEGRTNEFEQVRQELYDTERGYLQYLKTLIDVFLKPLCENAKFSEKLECKTLLADITSIMAVHKEILSSLRESRSIPEAFTAMVPYLKLYSSYAANYGRLSEALINLDHNRTFHELLVKLESSLRAFGNKFTALLVMPIQRIPRYVLLLKRLQETSTDEQEKKALGRILTGIGEITEHMEVCIRDYDNRTKLLEIQDKISVPGGVLVPGRRFIHEGTLFHRVNVGEPIYRERMFWLLSDVLIVGKARPSVFPAGRKYDLKFRFPLRHCSVHYDQWDGSLLIKCKNETIVVTSDTFDKLNKWRDLLEAGMSSSIQLRATLRKESSRLPIKTTKTNLKKALTKRLHHFTNMSYGVTRSGRATLSTSGTTSTADSALATRAMNQMTPKMNRVLITENEEIAEESFNSCNDLDVSAQRKRRAQSEFDRELETVVRKRYQKDPKTPTTRLNPLTPISSKSRPPRPPVTSDRNNEHSERRQKATVQRTLTQPQIRKLSYLEVDSTVMDDDCVSIGSIPDIERSKRISTIKRESVPWWVTESTPAEYAKVTEQSTLSKITSRCSIM